MNDVKFNKHPRAALLPKSGETGMLCHQWKTILQPYKMLVDWILWHFLSYHQQSLKNV